MTRGEVLWRAGQALIEHEQRDARTLALLKRLEWHREDEISPFCPECCWRKDAGHRPDCEFGPCELAALIRELEPPTPAGSRKT